MPIRLDTINSIHNAISNVLDFVVENSDDNGLCERAEILREMLSHDNMSIDEGGQIVIDTNVFTEEEYSDEDEEEEEEDEEDFGDEPDHPEDGEIDEDDHDPDR